MKKKMFFRLVGIFFCLNLLGSEHTQQLNNVSQENIVDKLKERANLHYSADLLQKVETKGLLALPSDMILSIINNCTISDISRLKKVCKQFNGYDIAQLICHTHDAPGHVCSSMYLKELTYWNASRRLFHLVKEYDCSIGDKFLNEKLFLMIYGVHLRKRDAMIIRKMYEKSYPKISRQDIFDMCKAVKPDISMQEISNVFEKETFCEAMYEVNEKCKRVLPTISVDDIYDMYKKVLPVISMQDRRNICFEAEIVEYIFRDSIRSRDADTVKYLLSNSTRIKEYICNFSHVLVEPVAACKNKKIIKLLFESKNNCCGEYCSCKNKIKIFWQEVVLSLFKTCEKLIEQQHKQERENLSEIIQFVLCDNFHHITSDFCICKKDEAWRIDKYMGALFSCNNQEFDLFFPYINPNSDKFNKKKFDLEEIKSDLQENNNFYRIGLYKDIQLNRKIVDWLKSIQFEFTKCCICEEKQNVEWTKLLIESGVTIDKKGFLGLCASGCDVPFLEQWITIQKNYKNLFLCDLKKLLNMPNGLKIIKTYLGVHLNNSIHKIPLEYLPICSSSMPQEEQIQLLELFIQRGINIFSTKTMNFRDKKYTESYLYAACNKENPSPLVAEFLIERGANIYEKQQDGNSPLDLMEKQDVFQALVKKIRFRNAEGISFLIIVFLLFLLMNRYL